MNRRELDAFVEHHALSREAVETALELTHARPTAADLERFALRVVELAGVLSLAAGVVFAIAANWEALAVFGRFALVELFLAATVGAALWQPPPHAIGRHALLLAFIATGGLFALFGQTYQTGADVYELFLTWAALGAVFAVAGQWSVTWAAWLLVLNVAFALYCGWLPQAGWLWIAIAVLGEDLQPSELLLGPMILNALLWLLALALARTRLALLAPPWLGRFALACGIGFGTWAGILVIVDSEAGGALVLTAVLTALAAIAIFTWRRRRDAFPLALIAASSIAITTVGIGEHADFGSTGWFFTLALWLIASSTLSGLLLMHTVRAWSDKAGRT